MPAERLSPERIAAISERAERAEAVWPWGENVSYVQRDDLFWLLAALDELVAALAAATARADEAEQAAAAEAQLADIAGAGRDDARRQLAEARTMAQGFCERLYAIEQHVRQAVDMPAWSRNLVESLARRGMDEILTLARWNDEAAALPEAPPNEPEQEDSPGMSRHPGPSVLASAVTADEDSSRSLGVPPRGECG
jgi:hypothetical protein